MSRSPRLLAAALPLALLLGACGGSGDATLGSVRDQVKSALLDRNEDGDESNNLSEEEAGTIADCVARTIFESGEFSKEERNEATSASDGDAPDPDLVAKVQRVVTDCEDDAGGEGEG